MANQRHVDILLRDGVAKWNTWRKEEPTVLPDLIGADLTGVDLAEADLSMCGLMRARLHKAILIQARLDEAVLTGAVLGLANLTGADLSRANLVGAHFVGATLTGANLTRANLSGANFWGANLTDVDLTGALCIHTMFDEATLIGCNVYGISVWDVFLEGAKQADLHITLLGNRDSSKITVDNLEVAQFLYLLVSNPKIRAVLDTITSKVVLILGRFSEERKPVLDALREVLRRHPNGYIPVLFDFDQQQDKPVLETVKTLANLARFVIADLTDSHMVRSELTYIIPNVPTVPVQPIIQSYAGLPPEYGTWALYRSFLPVYRYADLPHLLASLNELVITPVEKHVVARRVAGDNGP